MPLRLRSQLGSNAQEETSRRKDAAWAIRTCAPGVIQQFDADALTVSVQLGAQGIAYDTQGNETDETLPLLVDVPVIFPHGGGVSLTFPLRSGDECLIVFSDRCIDFWHQSGGIQKSASPRNHNISDAFVIPGPFSQPNVLQNVSTDSVQLRTDDGKSFIELKQSGSVTVTSPHTTVNGPATINGDLMVNGSIAASGDVTGAGISLDSHIHSGVTSGDSETGAPQ